MNRLLWQLGKSLIDCNKHMFESKMAADVCFAVGPQSGHQEMVWAHSYVLRSRTPVFEALLDPAWMEQKHGEGDRCVVNIPDIPVDAFNEILRQAC